MLRNLHACYDILLVCVHKTLMNKEIIMNRIMYFARYWFPLWNLDYKRGYLSVNGELLAPLTLFAVLESLREFRGYLWGCCQGSLEIGS